MTQSRPFLTAEWRHLVMLNYVAEPGLLAPFVPHGTELDLWQGRTMFSLVGFRFLRTRLKGWAIPFHQDFAEVNLRFYVRRAAADGWRRGVVFLREIVPKFAVSWVANSVYEEHYLTAPLSYRVQIPASRTDRTGRCDYVWRLGRQQWEISAEFHGLPQPLSAGSEEEFIAEHYWGYTRHADSSTSEYRVDHPPWRVWAADRAEFQGDAGSLYGSEFAASLNKPPASTMVFDGSPVTVFTGHRVTCDADTLATPVAACLASPARAR